MQLLQWFPPDHPGMAIAQASITEGHLLSTARRRILVVSDTLALANNLLTWLTDAGYAPALVSTFSAGKEHLRTAPDILITELKLREYNGLHLALRAHRDGIPTAVIGADPAFASDAHEIGASYVSGDNVHRDDILLLVDGLLSVRAVQEDRGSGAGTGPVRSQHSTRVDCEWIETRVDEGSAARLVASRPPIH